jgi:hypothetical protein
VNEKVGPPRKKKSMITMVNKAESFASNKTLVETNFKSVLIIGGVQQGKSTLANIFLGNELATVKDKTGVKIEQKVVKEPIIGHTNKQETLIAYDQIVQVSGESVTLFDCAALGGDLSIV